MKSNGKLKQKLNPYSTPLQKLLKKLVLSAAVMEALRYMEPPPIVEWSEQNIVLTKPPSEEPGPIRLMRTPYLIPILQACDDPYVEEVVFCKPAQIGGTQFFFILIDYKTTTEPCSAMLVMADEDTADYMMVKRLQKSLKASPALSRLYDENKATKKEMTLKNGSYIAMAWASSVAKLASRVIKIVCFDEVDKPGYYVTTREADPIYLGKQRAESIFNKLVLIASTPTDEKGNIWTQLLSCPVICDIHVACPFCGQPQPLRWSPEYAPDFPDYKYRAHDGTIHNLGRIVWEGELDATPEQIEQAGYMCGECGAIWNTLDKNKAIQNFMAVSRNEVTHQPKKVGFHVWRLYSLLGKSGKTPRLVEEYIGAVQKKQEGDEKPLQGFVNNVLALPWKQVITVHGEADLAKAVTTLEPQTVPRDAVALTCVIDVQKYGYWFTVWAWAKDFTSWLIHYGQLATEEELDALLFESSYPIDGEHPDKRIRIWRAAKDTGGGEQGEVHITDRTYIWLRKNQRGRGCPVWGTKGSSNPLPTKVQMSKTIDKLSNGRAIPGGIQLVLIDTYRMKDLLHFRFEQAIEGLKGGAYLHSQTEKTFFTHIMAEEKQRDKKGKEEWIRVKNRPNHLLDCSILAHICADPEWPGGGVQLVSGPLLAMPPQKQPKEQDDKPKSSWLQTPRGDNWLRR